MRAEMGVTRDRFQSDPVQVHRDLARHVIFGDVFERLIIPVVGPCAAGNGHTDRLAANDRAAGNRGIDRVRLAIDRLIAGLRINQRAGDLVAVRAGARVVAAPGSGVQIHHYIVGRRPFQADAFGVFVVIVEHHTGVCRMDITVMTLKHTGDAHLKIVGQRHIDRAIDARFIVIAAIEIDRSAKVLGRRLGDDADIAAKGVATI